MSYCDPCPEGCSSICMPQFCGCSVPCIASVPCFDAPPVAIAPLGQPSTPSTLVYAPMIAPCPCPIPCPCPPMCCPPPSGNGGQCC
nr:unnamed protein product [Callosobruchus analis]